MIDLKIPVKDVPAKAAVTFKQLTGLPFSVVKHRAENNEYIVEFPAYNDDGLRLINKLKNLKASIKLYEGGLCRSSQARYWRSSLHAEAPFKNNPEASGYRVVTTKSPVR